MAEPELLLTTMNISYFLSWSMWDQNSGNGDQ